MGRVKLIDLRWCSRRKTIIKQVEAYKELPKETIQEAMSNAGFKSVVEQYKW